MSTPSPQPTFDPNMDPNAMDPNAMDPAAAGMMDTDPQADQAAAQNHRKQDLNVYTVMLVISFVCLVIAIILMVVELGRWGDLGSMPYRTDSARPANLNVITSPFWR